jgi:hypothetical protein
MFRLNVEMFPPPSNSLPPGEGEIRISSARGELVEPWEPSKLEVKGKTLKVQVYVKSTFYF